MVDDEKVKSQRNNDEIGLIKTKVSQSLRFMMERGPLVARVAARAAVALCGAPSLSMEFGRSGRKRVGPVKAKEHFPEKLLQQSCNSP
jgi:hypothetical protein